MKKSKKSALTFVLSSVLCASLGAGAFFALHDLEKNVIPMQEGNGNVITAGAYSDEALTENVAAYAAEYTTEDTTDYTAFSPRCVLSYNQEYLLIIVGIDDVNLYDAIDLKIIEHETDKEVDLMNTYYTGITVKTGVGEETRTWTMDELFATEAKIPNGMIVHEVPYVADCGYQITPSLTKKLADGEDTPETLECKRTLPATKLYELTLTGATLDGAQSISSEGETYTYQVAYGANIKVTATVISENSDKQFVAWENGNNERFGDLGTGVYEGTMPRENATFSAVSATYTQKTIRNYTEKGEGYSSVSVGDWQNVSAINVKRTGGVVANTGSYPENLEGEKSFSTVDGAKLIRAVFKNNSAEPLKIQVYASSYGAIAESPVIDLPAKENDNAEVVIKYFTLETLVNACSWGFRFMEDTASDLDLSMGFGYCDLYPNETDTEAQYVTVEGGSASSTGRTDASDYSTEDFTGRKFMIWYMGTGWSQAQAPHITYNATGTTFIGTRNEYVSGDSATVYSKITNMADGKTVYLKVTNQSIDGGATYTFGIAKFDGTTLGEVLTQSYAVFIRSGQEALLKLDVSGIEYTGDYALFVKFNKTNLSDTQYNYNIAIKMTYNDVYGYNLNTTPLWSMDETTAKTALGNKVFSGRTPLIVEGEVKYGVTGLSGSLEELQGMSGYRLMFQKGQEDAEGVYSVNAPGTVNTTDGAKRVKLILSSEKQNQPISIEVAALDKTGKVIATTGVVKLEQRNLNGSGDAAAYGTANYNPNSAQTVYLDIPKGYDEVTWSICNRGVGSEAYNWVHVVAGYQDLT